MVEIGAPRDGDGHVGGKRYSRLVATSRFPAVRMLREMRRADPTNITARIFLRTLALGFPIVLYPLSLIVGKPRAFVHGVVSRWAADVCRIGRMRIEVRGNFAPDRGRSYLFASNHASPADIPILCNSLPVVPGFVANRDIAVIGIIAFWTVRAGGVFVNRGDPASRTLAFRKLVLSLRQGNSIALFPEGFMSKHGELNEFKRGGLAAAAAAGAVIVPVHLAGTREICLPGDFIFKPDKRAVVALGEPIDTTALTRADRKEIHLLVQSRVAELRSSHGAVAQP